MDGSPGWIALLVVLGVVAVVLFAIAVVYLIRLVRLWRVVNDPSMPASAKVTFWAAMIYAISPVDVLPDPVYLDDVGVLVAAVSIISAMARRRGLRRRTDPPLPPAAR